MFVETNILSQQKFCRGKHTFVMTKKILVAAPASDTIYRPFPSLPPFPHPPIDFGLFHNAIDASKNSDATFKCYYALHSYVQTAFSHDQFSCIIY